MPFTTTHMLAVVPIGYALTRSVPFSALAIGSLVPDWSVFMPIGPNYRVTHSFPGIITACVPLGLALYLFFHGMLKKAMFELLPLFLRQRLILLMTEPRIYRPLSLVQVSIGLAIGAMTHVVWDAFTHQGRWGIVLFPVLDRVLLTIGSVEFRGYSLLQHGSSLIGLPLLLLCLVAWLRTRPPRPLPPSILPNNIREAMQIILVLVPLSLGLMMFAQLLTGPMSYYTVNRVIFEYVTETGFTLVVLLGCYSLFFYSLILLQRRWGFEG